jgi:hypothetical protein
MLMSRRSVLGTILGGLGGYGLTRGRPALAAPELAVPSTLPGETLDFDKTAIDGWTTVEGKWAVEDMPGAPNGARVLVQRAVKNQFNLILTPLGPYSDIDVSMKFKPISGKEDASGGIVFRFSEGRYYVVRANALEDNVRLYVYDRGRRQIATSNVKAPTLGQWHTLRVVAVEDRMQAWLDGQLCVEHRDTRLKSGRVGLWTKADSVTAFDDLTIRGVKRGDSP